MAQEEFSAHWHQRVQLYAAEVADIPAGKIVFLGNSITEGFDLNTAFPEDQPVNRGIASDHLDGALARLDTSVILLKPAQLHILLGINDIGRGDSDSLILARYEEVITTLQSVLPDLTIWITSILPASPEWSNCPPDKINRINARLEDLAKKNDCRWLDLHSLFVNRNGYIKSELTHDGLHLNQAGYAIWTQELKMIGLK